MHPKVMPIGSHSLYRTLRDPATTPEPMSERAVAPGRRFVVQHHKARREHYDLRLEYDGVLRSWAVPKGPSADPADKRLAIETEPHPLEYTAFEGVIPSGSYGAGAMIVWDQGSYTPLKDFGAGLESGKLLFELHGYKLQGKWTLVRTRENWLLIKEYDAFTKEAADATAYPADSIFSGLTPDQLNDPEKVSRNLATRLKGAGAGLAPQSSSSPKPMLATASQPFTRADWVFELKYDGYRAFAVRDENGLRVLSRNGRDLSATFPDLVHSLRHLPFTAFVVDGEIVCHDESGMPSFGRLQRRAGITRDPDVTRAMLASPATLYAFDLLHAEGFDVCHLALTKRKELLESMLPSIGPVRYSEHIQEEGEALYASVEKMGLEGIVAKRATSSYQQGRSPDWCKTATTMDDEFVVVGWTDPKSGGRHFAALVLATFVAGELTYVGRAGTGFSSDEAEAIFVELKSLDEGAVVAGTPEDLKANWVAPRLVASVRYKQRTEKGHLRSPVYLCLRNDKEPEECGDATVDRDSRDTPSPVIITNPDKVLWPEAGYTKTDLLDYYRGIAHWMLPYLKDRPVVLLRYPDGIDGKSFFQKNAPPGLPRWIRTEHVYSKTRGSEIRYLLIDSEEALAYVANLAAVELHVWASTTQDLDRPTWTIIDLDPKDATFADVIRVARRVRKICQEIDLPACVKTSGSTGLHILLPTGRQLDFQQSRALATLIASVVHDREPECSTLNRSLAKRESKVYIDCGQNRAGRTIAAPFSVRARTSAPVSMPLRWPELSTKRNNESYTMANAKRRLQRMKVDPIRAVLKETPDFATAVQKLEDLISGQ